MASPNVYLVLDFEATCDEPVQLNPQEVIEFPVVAVNTTTLETIAEFHQYVEPDINPVLTPFCTELTGIRQDQVQGRPHLPQTLHALHAWMLQHGFLRNSDSDSLSPGRATDTSGASSSPHATTAGGALVGPAGASAASASDSSSQSSQTGAGKGGKGGGGAPTQAPNTSDATAGPPRVLVVTCGDWDVKHLHAQAASLGVVHLPSYLSSWLNVKVLYEQVMYKDQKKKPKRGGMMDMLAGLGLQHTGRHHAGIDDARNIAAILCELVRRGGVPQASAAIRSGQLVKLMK